MKLTITCVALFFCVHVGAQTDTVFVPKLTVKWAPAGLLVGNAVLQGEYNFGGRQSLTVKFGLPKNTTRSFDFDGRDANFDMKAMSFLSGYRMYFSKKRQMKGFYWEPYFQYVHHSSEGMGRTELDYRPVIMRFTNDYSAAGVGIQLGAQFMIAKRVVVDVFFLGPQINSASNNFKAVETSNSIPWNGLEKEDAEKTIKEFINKFPFIGGDRTMVNADRNTKTVTADFKGGLPGVRTGISVGYAF